MGILQRDRWCMPWVSCYESSGFDVKFCVDGKGYVEPNIWNASGSFDEARRKRIATAQAFALAPLFDSRYTPDTANHRQKPPAYVRPGEMPEPETRHYSFDEMLKALAV